MFYANGHSHSFGRKGGEEVTKGQRKIIRKIEKLEDMLIEGNLNIEEKIRIKGMIQGLELAFRMVKEVNYEAI
jgi:hypothetical protein